MKYVSLFVAVLATFANISHIYSAECPSEGFAQLPSPNCSIIIVCAHGQPTEIQCPSGLYYSPELEYCDYAENVPDCVGGTRAPISGSTTPVTERPTENPTTRTTTVRPTTTDSPPTNILTRCGQTITALSGSIEYKLLENYAAGELCAFVIRSQSCSQISLELESEGINIADGNAISVLYYHQEKNGIGLLANLGPTKRSVTVPFGLAIVVFRPLSSLGTGFRVSFRATGTASCLPGQNSVYNTETGSLSLPLRSNNTEREVDVLVLTAGARQITHPRTALQLAVQAPNPIDFCNDRFLVWKLDGDDIVGYVPCGSGDQIYTTRGLYIITSVLTTDTSPATGNLIWEEVTEE
ncbi:Endochitinase [Orchesella cincta]|uniref:Endochitinase n=1 Tax=Orchesella cincta TaxID=48709 RepID=A0A1D2N9E1_ORCCI|nr:Endochitinase [Orchesella cincta]